MNCRGSEASQRVYSSENESPRQNEKFVYCTDVVAALLVHHRGLLRVTKMRTLRMAMRRSLKEVIARMVSWARFSRGRTASSHQHQAGPSGLAYRGTRCYLSELLIVTFLLDKILTLLFNSLLLITMQIQGL